MTIASEITRIKTAIADAYTACQGMGATMPAVLNSDNLEQCIASISGGGPTPPQTKKRLVSIADDTDSNKLVLYTDDGVNWNTSTMPNTRDWCNVFYGNGKFIATEYNPNVFAYSTDGINWTEGTLPASCSSREGWTLGAYGNNIYLVASTDSNYTAEICYSSDGINWNYYQKSWEILTVMFDGTRFIVLAGYIDNNNLKTGFFTSTDGINWSNPIDISINPYTPWNTGGRIFLRYINNKYYLLYKESSSSYILVSNTPSNLESWTQLLEANYSNVAWAATCVINNELKAFSGYPSFSTQAAAYASVSLSNDTATWVGSSVPRLNYRGEANVINDRAIVLGYGSDQYIYSTDGTTWTTGTLPASSGWISSCIGEVAI